MILALAAAPHASAQGIAGIGHALAIDGGTVYVGGDFTGAQGSAPGTEVSAQGIVRWDSSLARWSSVPGGDLQSGRVEAIAVDAGAGVLFVGGAFSAIDTGAGGTLGASNGAVLDLSTDQWSPLAGGFDGQVFDVDAIGNGNAAFVGIFGAVTDGGGTSVLANKMARWDGANITPLVVDSNIILPPGSNAGITALDLRAIVSTGADSFLFAGNFGNATSARYVPQGECASLPFAFLHDMAILENGLFRDVCAQTADEQCSEFGTSAQPPFAGGFVEDILVVGQDVYFTGSFAFAGCSFGTSPGFANGVARVRNGAVEILSDADTGVAGFDGLAGPGPGVLEGRALAEGPGGTIFVGGAFVNAGGLICNSVAMYDPSAGTWTPLVDSKTGETGVELSSFFGGGAGEVNAMAYDASDDRLYLTGSFAFAGGKVCGNIAYFDFVDNTWNPLEQRPEFAIDLGIRLGNQFDVGPFIGEDLRPANTPIELLSEAAREQIITNGVDLLVENEDLVPVSFRLVSRAELDGWSFTVRRDGVDITDGLLSDEGMAFTFAPGQREVFRVEVDGEFASFSVASLRFSAILDGSSRGARGVGGTQVNAPQDLASFFAETDCNGNNTPDKTEIALESSLDGNGNGRLDSCEIVADPMLDADISGALDSVERAFEASADPFLSQQVPISDGRFPTFADRDGDGRDEIYLSEVPGAGVEQVVAFMPDQNGNLGLAEPQFDLPDGVMACGRILFADIDCDGFADAILPVRLSSGEKALAIAFSGGTNASGFGDAVIIEEGPMIDAADVTFGVSDLDLNGKPDVFAIVKEPGTNGAIAREFIEFINIGAAPGGGPVVFLEVASGINGVGGGTQNNGEFLVDLTPVREESPKSVPTTPEVIVTTTTRAFTQTNVGGGVFAPPTVAREGAPDALIQILDEIHKKQRRYAADLNGDGKPDHIVVTTIEENGERFDELRVFMSINDGTDPVPGSESQLFRLSLRELYELTTDSVMCVMLSFRNVSLSSITQEEDNGEIDIVVEAIVNGSQWTAHFTNLGQSVDPESGRSRHMGFTRTAFFTLDGAMRGVAPSTPPVVIMPDLNGDGIAETVVVRADAGMMDVFVNPNAPSTVCAGDCDGSGAVDFADLVAMLFEFGTPGTNTGCDTDGSGTVNFGDLVAALFVFGPCP